MSTAAALAPRPADDKTAQPVRGHGFGSAPVFLASISTILGAVLFLRFGYAVAHAGLAGSLLIVALGHLVTVPTALAIAEIATNRRVEGGGEYFIISRSFGKTIGAAIGISLYLSQAVSVAFYLIALGEAFRPLASAFESALGAPFDTRVVSLPATVLLGALVVVRGANVGVAALWVVAGILALTLALFFLGGPVGADPIPVRLFARIPAHDPFMLVFAVVFPAFTGVTAGVGLSGDLAQPRRSIPRGILSATVVGLVVYVAVVFKLAASAPPALLGSDPLVMSQIALWGPAIPIGLACATLSSAIGSILVAPRTLQALAADGVAPGKGLNALLAAGVGKTNEPRNATLLTVGVALLTVAAGSIDVVARLISMFFMTTYGALCSISFLEHFAARPSYRPRFRSKWYLSLVGAAACLFLMFQMDPLFALAALSMMGLIYRGVHRGREGRGDLAAMFQGVMTQATRLMHVRLQQSGHWRPDEWRPSVIMISGRTFERKAPIDFLKWLCHRYGFGTLLHLIPGQLEPDTFRESRKDLARLVQAARSGRSGLYVDTMISPSMRTALAQTLQVPGVAGMENNTILFEVSVHDGAEALQEAHDGCRLAWCTRMNTLVLRHGDYFFGSRSSVHVWLTWHDYRNANLMILLSYLLLGHPDWQRAEARIFAAFPEHQVEKESAKLGEMIASGRLPVSRKNVEIIATADDVDFTRLVEKRSSAADLVLLGFTEEKLKERGPEVFTRHPVLRDVLFVAAQQQILMD